MTEIDVPDWVVARARAAVREFWENYKGGVDCGEYDAAMRAALTAALGAWVVPVGHGYVAKGSQQLVVTDERFSSFPQVFILYTLRQEKPE